MIIPPARKKNIPAMPLEECLAKTIGYPGELKPGCDVYTHSLATCQIIRHLREIWKDTPRERLLAPVVDCLCAFHDIGKVSPGFQQKIYDNLQKTLNLGLGNLYNHIDHASISRASLYTLGEDFANLAGMHHGLTRPNEQYRDEDEVCGGENWSKLRKELLRRLTENLDLLTSSISEGIPDELQSVILGATILSDWLSSSIELPFGSCPTDEDIRDTVLNAGFIPCSIKKGLSFQDIFKDSDNVGYEPNELQKICMGHICPGAVYVIESEMGSGKTEAALYIAYRLLESKEANGIYFALPTQLTSEKIHERINQFLPEILPETQKHNAMLIHGNAWLKWNLWELDDSDSTLNAMKRDSWFQTKKRALLATFGAGTIDQALLSVINVKHKALRAFALSGKVVIIDEIHSYDHYTGSLISSLVHKLQHWGCTVVLLSATLTEDSKKTFAHLPSQPGKSPHSSYPLVTIRQKDGKISEYPFPCSMGKRVNLNISEVEEEALSLAYDKALKGEQVLWIENTVRNAQYIFSKFNQVHDKRLEIGLVHSRFPKIVRDKNENHWTSILGKNALEKRRECGRILVGTQVLEQSIDIDADFLITRLAPIDMIFQRIGRLWRHRATQRPVSASCSSMVLFDEIMKDPLQIGNNSGKLLPYDPYVLYRTLDCIRQLKAFLLPDDIRKYLELVYAERNESDESILRLKLDMTRKANILEQMASVSLGIGLSLQNDDTASTRINDTPTVQVLLLRKDKGNPQNTQMIYTPFEKEPIPIPAAAGGGRTDRLRSSIRLQQSLISVRESIAPRYNDFETDFLSPLVYTGNDDFRPIRAAYLDDDGRLLNQSAIPLNYKYSPLLGYFEQKEKK